MIKKILLPIDGSDLSNAAIEKAKSLAVAFNSEIILLHVMEMSQTNYPSYPYKFSTELIANYQKESKEISEKIIEDAQKRLICLEDRVSIKILEGNPAEEIIKYAEAAQVDLVIMGSRGFSGMRYMLGSVARKVTMNINRPIFIIK